MRLALQLVSGSSTAEFCMYPSFLCFITAGTVAMGLVVAVQNFPKIHNIGTTGSVTGITHVMAPMANSFSVQATSRVN